jgi:hypothetical protein
MIDPLGVDMAGPPVGVTQEDRDRGQGLYLCRYHLAVLFYDDAQKFAIDYIRSALTGYNFFKPNSRESLQAAAVSATQIAEQMRHTGHLRPCCQWGDRNMLAIAEMRNVSNFLNMLRGFGAPVTEEDRGKGKGTYLCDYHADYFAKVSDMALFWAVAQIRAMLANGQFFNGNTAQFAGAADLPAAVAAKIRERARLPVCCMLGDERLANLLDEYHRAQAQNRASGVKLSPKVYEGWKILRKQINGE